MFHAENTNDPKEVRNWKIHLLGEYIAAMTILGLSLIRGGYVKALGCRCLL